jgi:muramoyltetrapeptide carboxypeptidase
VRDPYDILGLDRSATQDEIKSAFRRAATQHHPDKNPGDDGAQQRFKEVNAAYQILSDPQKRAAFDQIGAHGLRLDAVARKKRYMGYSDAGSLLAGMYKAGFQHLAHGPMASDSVHDDATARGALSWLTTGRTDWMEPSLATDPRPAVAFNLTILNELTGTALEPDLSDHVLMLEEVSEAAYRIDRMMFHLTSQASIRRVAGIRLGRVSDVTPNDPDFGQTPEEIVRYWCLRSGIPFLGSADIGHDGANKVVPFGRA